VAIDVLLVKVDSITKKKAFDLEWYEVTFTTKDGKQALSGRWTASGPNTYYVGSECFTVDPALVFKGQVLAVYLDVQGLEARYVTFYRDYHFKRK
jgi:hypothetical protein